MEQSVANKWIVLLIFSTIISPFFGANKLENDTHKILMSVNRNWKELTTEIKHTNSPTNEQELIQLHLQNVISYLENKTIDHLNHEQKENRAKNISFLKSYCTAADFPINTITTHRIPIFIDYKNTHCAVGQLLKENGLGIMAQEIATDQLLSYLKDIKHPKLGSWQEKSGLSLFELALIQPTYGPPIPVCATQSPIEWFSVSPKDSKFASIYLNEWDNSVYAVSKDDDLGLKQYIKKYNSKTREWTKVGAQIYGDILDLTFINGELILSVLLPDEKYSHQLIKLIDDKWEKLAHFNGSIISIEVLEGKLYVLGNFTEVNDAVQSKFVVIENGSIIAFQPPGMNHSHFDHMIASNSTLFLLSNGGIYKYKNDTMFYLKSIQYYSYIKNMNLDAIEDTLFVSSMAIQGYNSYYDQLEHTSYFNSMFRGRDSQYNSVHFTNGKKVNGKMMISGDFKTSTLQPQVNDERYLTECKSSESAHWMGEGLLYETGQVYYPIMKEGVVLDIVQINDRVYALKADGSIVYANINSINSKIAFLRKMGGKN